MKRYTLILVLVSILACAGARAGTTSWLTINNFAESTLDGAISDSDLSLDVQSGDGAEFPSTYNFHIAVGDETQGYEIMTVTNRSTDTFTVTRAAEDSSATAFTDGTPVVLAITKQYLTELQDAINAIEDGSKSLDLVDLPDGTSTIKFGDDDDIHVGYDEAGDNRLEWSDGTNLLMHLTDNSDVGDLGITGDLTVSGNDIKDSGGSAAISFDGSQNTTFAGTIDATNATVNTTASYQASKIVHTKTAGVTDQNDNFHGLYNIFGYNHNGGVIGLTYGTLSQIEHDDGDIGTSGDNKNSFALYAFQNLDGGAIYGSGHGIYSRIDQEAGNSVEDDLCGIYVNLDADGTVGNKVYGLYLKEASNIDYGIYQDGTAANVLGGTLTLNNIERNSGSTEKLNSDYQTEVQSVTFDVEEATMDADDGSGIKVASIDLNFNAYVVRAFANVSQGCGDAGDTCELVINDADDVSTPATTLDAAQDQSAAGLLMYTPTGSTTVQIGMTSTTNRYVVIGYKDVGDDGSTSANLQGTLVVEYIRY